MHAAAKCKLIANDVRVGRQSFGNRRTIFIGPARGWSSTGGRIPAPSRVDASRSYVSIPHEKGKKKGLSYQGFYPHQLLIRCHSKSEYTHQWEERIWGLSSRRSSRFIYLSANEPEDWLLRWSPTVSSVLWTISEKPEVGEIPLHVPCCSSSIGLGISHTTSDPSLGRLLARVVLA